MQYYFRSAGTLLEDRCPLKAVLAWVWAMQERIPRRAVKLLRQHAQEGRSGARRRVANSVNAERLQWSEASREIAQRLGSNRIPTISPADRQVRDNFLHGRSVMSEQIRSSCSAVLVWCSAIDDAVRAHIGIGPMDNLRRRSARN